MAAFSRRILVALCLLLLTAPSTLAAERGVASWYGPRHHGKLMANGERFDQWGFTAAHRSLPFGTILRVRNLRTDRIVYVVITDRGPFSGNRVLDLSRGAAQSLDMISSGIDRVEFVITHRPRRNR